MDAILKFNFLTGFTGLMALAKYAVLFFEI